VRSPSRPEIRLPAFGTAILDDGAVSRGRDIRIRAGLISAVEAEHTDPARARPRLEEHLAHGVTTVADLFGHPPATFARRAMAAAEPGTLPRVLVAGQGLTGPGGHPTSTVYAWSERLAAGAAVETDDPARARDHVRRLAESDHADLVKIACSDLRGSIARLKRL
jgi:hypothetical protein